MFVIFITALFGRPVLSTALMLPKGEWWRNFAINLMRRMVGFASVPPYPH
jgi:hypothetical protein